MEVGLTIAVLALVGNCLQRLGRRAPWVDVDGLVVQWTLEILDKARFFGIFEVCEEYQ